MTAIGIDLERHGRISQEDYGWGSVLPSGTAQPDLPLAEVYGPAVILTNHRELPLSAQLIRATRWFFAVIRDTPPVVMTHPTRPSCYAGAGRVRSPSISR